MKALIADFTKATLCGAFFGVATVGAFGGNEPSQLIGGLIGAGLLIIWVIFDYARRH